MLTSVKCVELLAGRDRCRIGNNTYLEDLGGGVFGVLLHKTHVVKVYPDGTYTLHTGGWLTATTLARINEYGPMRLYRRQGRVYHGDGIPFTEGMRCAT